VRVELLEAVEGTVWSGSWSSDPPRLLLVPDLAPKARGCSLSDGGRGHEPGPDEVNGFAYLVDTDGFRVEPSPRTASHHRAWLAGGSLYD